METFATRFKRAAKSAKVTHQHVANMLGLDRSTISHWVPDTTDKQTISKIIS